MLGIDRPRLIDRLDAVSCSRWRCSSFTDPAACIIVFAVALIFAHLLSPVVNFVESRHLFRHAARGLAGDCLS